MKIMHCDDNRTERQKVFVETADGKFKYQLFMDYAKGLPDYMEMVPVMGNVSGGCCDKEGNLYVGLRGGGWMTTKPVTCIIKLDKDGNFVDVLGEGLLPELHFFNITDRNTIAMAMPNQSCIYEMSMDGKQIVGMIGEPNKPCENETDPYIFEKMRIHNGIAPTEPSMSYGMEIYQAYLKHSQRELGGPFHGPTDVDFDSEGNWYISDGYGNFAVHKFDSKGNLLATWGGKGIFDGCTDTPGKFLVVHSLCVDPNDNIWVCDREKDAVHIFNKNGEVIAYFSHNLSQPSGIDTDGQYVYVVGRGGYVTIFDLDFNIVGELGFYNGNLRGHDLAADKDGNLYLFPTHANYEHQIIALKRIKE